MELKRIEMAQKLWQMLRGILRDGGYVKSGSNMRNTANSFEDDLYDYDPPKSEADIQKTPTNNERDGDSVNYTELLMAVNKITGQTRHETALECIKFAEKIRMAEKN